MLSPNLISLCLERSGNIGEICESTENVTFTPTTETDIRVPRNLVEMFSTDLHCAMENRSTRGFIAETSLLSRLDLI